MIVSIVLVLGFHVVTLFSTRQGLAGSIISNHADQLPSLQKAYWNGARMPRPATGAVWNFTLTEQYHNPTILRDGCAVTVLLVDPDLDDDVLWALESVADNIHPIERTCFLLQTSVCMLRKPNVSHAELYSAKVDRFMRSVRPKFQTLIQQGNVRMTVLDHAKYGLRSCLNFYNPSFLFENHRYWGPDEFDLSDSDLILMMQGDAVLCHDLNTEKWKDVAWGECSRILVEVDKTQHFNHLMNTLCFCILSFYQLGLLGYLLKVTNPGTIAHQCPQIGRNFTTRVGADQILL